MANNKNPNEKQPGEKEPGKFHYNPGNMSGKTIVTNEFPTASQCYHERKPSRAQRSKALTNPGLFADRYRSAAPTLWHIAQVHLTMKHRTQQERIR